MDESGRSESLSIVTDVSRVAKLRLGRTKILSHDHACHNIPASTRCAKQELGTVKEAQLGYKRMNVGESMEKPHIA